MKDYLNLAKKRVWENRFLKTEMLTRVTTVWANFKDLEFIGGRMVLHMMDNLHKVKGKVEEHGYLTTLKTRIFTKANIKTIKNAVKENINGQMDRFILVLF